MANSSNTSDSSASESKQENNEEFHLPKKRLTTEFYVGLFFIVGSLCFAYLAINLANISLSDAGYYRVKAEFDNISGLSEGAAVEIAGVPVGEVSRITLSSTNAMVELKLQEEVKLRDDDIAAIRTKGIIGDRYVKIIPGASSETLSNGDVLMDTESVVDFEDIIGKIIHRME